MSEKGVGIWAAQMLILYNDVADDSGSLRPWRRGGGVLEMPARELAAMRLIRTAQWECREADRKRRQRSGR